MHPTFQPATSNLLSVGASRWCLVAAFCTTLLTGVGSVPAATFTWDPLGNKTSGSDGSSSWASGKTGTADFSNGTTDTYSPNNGAVIFGSETAVTAAPTVSVIAADQATTIRLDYASVNSVNTGYTFVDAQGATYGITVTNLNLAAAKITSTIDVPLTTSTINFNAANTTLALANSSSTPTLLGMDSSSLPSPNIQGANLGDGASGTLQLNAGTYTIGTAIAIGNTGGSTANNLTGVQVNAGAVLTPSTSTSGPLTDLGVGGYAATGSGGIANGSGLLVINGGTVQTTGSTSQVYINNNAPNAASTALSGRLIVNSGVLSASNRIYIGNAFNPSAGSIAQTAQMDVNGGVVYVPNAGGIFLNSNSTGSFGGTATLNIAGGLTTLEPSSGIDFNFNSSVGSSVLNVSGGSLFLGSSGLSNGAKPGSSSITINLSGGTVGALSSGWSTPLPINLLANGNVTFQTSNAGAATSTAATVPAPSAVTSTVTLGGVLSGPGGFTTTSATTNSGGTLVLNAANTYTGATVVNGGTLLVNGSLGATTAAGAVTVNGGGTLLVPGSIGLAGISAGVLTVASGGTLGGTGVLTVTSATVAGTLAPAAGGATTGFLTLNTSNGLTLSGNLLIGITGSNSVSLSTNGTLTLSGATLTLSSALDGVSKYDVANYTGTLGGDASFANFAVPSGYTINYAGTSFLANGGTADIELDVAPVPEPATWAGCLLGLGLLAGAGYRRTLPPADPHVLTV